ALSRRVEPRSRDSRTSSGGDSGAPGSDFSFSEPDYATGFRWLGAGTRTLFHAFLGPTVRAAAGHGRSRRRPASRRTTGGEVRQGHLHLYGLRFFPAIAGRRARGGAVV